MQVTPELLLHHRAHWLVSVPQDPDGGTKLHKVHGRAEMAALRLQVHA